MSEKNMNDMTMLNDDQLSEVAGGGLYTKDQIGTGSKTPIPGSKELPFFCPNCNETIYISSQGLKQVKCPYCNTYHVING